jgi:DnaK suppressor protein
MDVRRARSLLEAERIRVASLLADTTLDGQDDRAASRQSGDHADPVERLTAEEGDDAVAAGLQVRLAAIVRAERRIEEGTYGYSIRSGVPIADARLSPTGVAGSDPGTGVLPRTYGPRSTLPGRTAVVGHLSPAANRIACHASSAFPSEESLVAHQRAAQFRRGPIGS